MARTNEQLPLHPPRRRSHGPVAPHPVAPVSAQDDPSFALRAGEPLADGLARVAGAQIDETTRRLRRPDGGVSAKDVHEARKSLKRLRALARLLRPALGEAAYARENGALRDAARQLAGARDAEVMVATLDALSAADDETAATHDDHPTLRAHLQAERDRATAHLRADAGPARQAAADLDQVRERAGSWLPADADWQSVEPGLRRIYREGRQRYRRARRRPTGEHLHEWRKRVKDLRYCTELLCVLDPEAMSARSALADSLGETLGEEHDLGVLAAFVDAHPELFFTPAERKQLRKRVRRERARLRRRALKLGDELFAPRPRRFTATLQPSAVTPPEPQ